MTGTELWKYSGNSEITIPTPIAGPGFVLITNGYRGVQPIVTVRPGAAGDITLKPGETKNASIAWSTTRGGPYIPTPVIYGDQLYILQNNGVFAAFKAATGEQIYQKRLGGRMALLAKIPGMTLVATHLESSREDSAARKARRSRRALLMRRARLNAAPDRSASRGPASSGSTRAAAAPTRGRSASAGSAAASRT